MENNTVPVSTLVSKVAAFKVIARDSLRMALIGPRLSRIANLESEVSEREGNIAQRNHRIAVANYELSKLDAQHPDYAAHKKEKEDVIKELTEANKFFADNVVTVKKEIEEQQVGIAKIVSGETKVSLDALTNLVEDMIKQDALNQVK